MHIKCIVQSREEEEKKTKRKRRIKPHCFMIDKVEPIIRTSTSFKKKKKGNIQINNVVLFNKIFKIKFCFSDCICA